MVITCLFLPINYHSVCNILLPVLFPLTELGVSITLGHMQDKLDVRMKKIIFTKYLF